MPYFLKPVQGEHKRVSLFDDTNLLQGDFRPLGREPDQNRLHFLIHAFRSPRPNFGGSNDEPPAIRFGDIQPARCSDLQASFMKAL